MLSFTDLTTIVHFNVYCLKVEVS